MIRRNKAEATRHLLLTVHGNGAEAIQAIGSEIAASLSDFHATSGSDIIRRLSDNCKLKYYNVLKKSVKKVLRAFMNLGKGLLPSDETLQCMEEYVCQFYLPGTKIKELGKLRWHLFKRSQDKAEKLPPALEALKYYFSRAHYQTMIWLTAPKAKPELPWSDEYGWIKYVQRYVSIIVKKAPAPEVIGIIKCACVS